MIDVKERSAARILIVDDQQANVLLLQRMLTNAGYTQVSSTQQPQQVADLYREHDHDLILLDLQMPDLDGFEVMGLLRQIRPDSYLPVIVLTASPEYKVRALQAGAKDFISKPFDLLEVKTRIHNLLEVRLLYRQLQSFNQQLERAVEERTSELRDVQQRYQNLVALASDWYWEQNQTGAFTHVSGPVGEMLGMGFSAFLGQAGCSETLGWVEAERASLHAQIESRQRILDFPFCRLSGDGSKRHFRVSGEPIFDDAGVYTGYRGVGIEVRAFATLGPQPRRAHAAGGSAPPGPLGPS